VLLVGALDGRGGEDRRDDRRDRGDHDGDLRRPAQPSPDVARELEQTRERLVAVVDFTLHASRRIHV
jgi:hypothetical protein